MPANWHRRIDSPSAVDGTKTVYEVILATIQSGSTHEDAALFAGISPATLSVWITRGLDTIQKTSKTGEEPPNSETIYMNLAFEVSRADAVSRVGLVADVRRNARRDGRVGLKLLSQRYPNTVWAERSRGLEITGPGGGALVMGVQPMSHQDAAQLRAELEQRRTELDALDVDEAAEA